MRKHTLVVLSMILLASCTNVTPTEVGFKISNSGDYRGVDSLPTVTGWNFFMPFFSNIIKLPTTQQHVVWSEGADEGSKPNENIVIGCKGGAGFKVDVFLNYRINAQKASKVYLRYKVSDLETITANTLRGIVRTAMNDVSGGITVDSLLNNQPAFEDSCRKLITKRFQDIDFIVDNFGIIHKPTPTDPSLATSINNKIKAKQDAETSIMELQKSIAEANKQVAKARGDSATKVIEANGEAEAVRKIQQVLSPTYVEYIRWSRWDGKLPATMLGSNTSFLLNK